MNEKRHLFDDPKNVQIVLRVLYVICASLVAADFFIHRHISIGWEELPTFYATYGFVACVILVLAAKLLRKIAMRDEDYYEAERSDVDR